MNKTERAWLADTYEELDKREKEHRERGERKEARRCNAVIAFIEEMERRLNGGKPFRKDK